MIHVEKTIKNKEFRMKVTEWKVFIPEEGCYKHNHIEAGWELGNHPTPLFESQQIWLSKDWAKKEARHD